MIGCDPEVLLVSQEDGTPVPALMIPGTKKEPFKIGCGAVQRDGVAAEFNINPTNDFDTFWNDCQEMLGHIEEMANKEGATITESPSLDFGEAAFSQEDFIITGCDESLISYNNQYNSIVESYESSSIRVAGGHIHLSYSRPNHVMNRMYTNLFETVCSGLLNDAEVNSRFNMNYTTRRKFYGCHYEYRNKPYGVEFRSPSNIWLFNRGLAKRMFHLVNSLRGKVENIGYDRLLGLERNNCLWKVK